MDEIELHASDEDGIAADDLDAGFVPVIRPAVGVAILDDESILLDPATGVSHLLDAPGTLVIRCFDEVSSIAEIAADIADILGLDEAAVREDVTSLVRTLGEQGLIQGVRRDPHAGHEHASGPQGVPLGADLGGWEGWAEVGQGDRTVLIHWGTGCGYCTRIAQDLVDLQPRLLESGVRLQLVTTGTAEALHSQVGDLSLPVLHVSSPPEFFAGLGTPSAYVVDAQRLVVEPLAVGSDQVPALCLRQLGDGGE